MNSFTTAPSSPRDARGFTLIEILVTVIVLSIGLLGLAGLQLTGLKYNHSAYMRSQATILTADIVDRMRANRDIALTGSYDIAMGAAAGVATCVGAVNCTPAAMAAADLYEWKQSLAAAMPSGDGSIARAVVGGITHFTIIVRWDDTRGEQAALQLAVETTL